MKSKELPDWEEVKAWRTGLMEDPFTADIIRFLLSPAVGEHVERPSRLAGREADQFFMEGGLLWKRKSGGEGYQLVVPHSHIRKVIEELHHSRVGGHCGVRKTATKVSARYYWPRWFHHVQECVGACKACQATAPGPDGREGPMGSLRCSRPWELVAMDMVGPLPTTTSGERFILVAICHFTKFVV